MDDELIDLFATKGRHERFVVQLTWLWGAGAAAALAKALREQLEYFERRLAAAHTAVGDALLLFRSRC